MSDLNNAQKIAAFSVSRNILVSAGAGTGKTRVLVERFLYLVTSHRALVKEILALTFTEKAASEMKQRIQRRFKEMNLTSARRDLEQAYISTIHAFCSRLLIEHPIEAGVDPHFSVLESEKTEILKEQAIQLALENGCKENDGTFGLLMSYGEAEIREGLKRVLDTARLEGKTISSFSSSSLPVQQAGPQDLRRGSEDDDSRLTACGNDDTKKVAGTFRALGDGKLAGDWGKYVNQESWTWDTVDEFREWIGSFSRRGGKTSKAGWKELTNLAKDYLAFRIQAFAAPRKESFQKLALSFESHYETLKREGGWLDFEDLQIKVFQLLTSETPAARILRDRYRKQFKFILVDESQDTNPLQMKLIEALTGTLNLLLVGDFKQSIYGFRGAFPEDFREKEMKYYKEKEGLFVSLNENFRSSASILEFVNRFFRSLWEEDNLEFEDLTIASFPHADPSSSLPAGQAGGNDEFLSSTVKVCIIEAAEGESLDRARMREAENIAHEIERMAEAGTPYGDVAILFQAMSQVGIYEQALKRAGIPYNVARGRGFYAQPEIRDMMSLLACIDNPLSDIALAATLRSPFFYVTDETLLWLSRAAKKTNENMPLYEAIKTFEALEEIPAGEKEKIREFSLFLEKSQISKGRLQISELIENLMQGRAFDFISLGAREGVRRFSNLQKLVGLARKEEGSGHLSLSDFIRIIRSLVDREVRESEATVESESSGNGVRLMTIHSAKGLEFPTVFVADLGRERQDQDSATVLALPGMGFAITAVNPKTLKEEEPLDWQTLLKEKKRKRIQEWKRLFYVAATRAKSRLILSGVYKPKKKEKEKYSEMRTWLEWVLASKELLPATVKFSTKSEPFFRAKAAPLAEKEIVQNLLKQKGSDPEMMGSDPFCFPFQETEEIFKRVQPAPLPQTRAIDLPVSAFMVFKKDPERFSQIYEWGFPDARHPEDPERSEGDEGSQVEILRLAALAQDDEIPSAAEFGTLIHSVLEHIDYTNLWASGTRLVNEIFKDPPDGARQEAEAIIKEFIKSPVCAQIRQAVKIYRELPFVLNGRHGLIYGVIDLLYQDSRGAWHVLDFKTAVGDEVKVAESAYDFQIAAYAYAVETLLGAAPKSGSVYFLKNQYHSRITFDAPMMKGMGQELNELQKQILERIMGVPSFL